jgi:transposase
MARVTRAVAHLSVEEVKHRLKTDPRSWCRQRWLIISNAQIEPRKAEEIAKHCGVSKAMVHQVISSYNRLGVQAVETPGKGGRRHEYLTLEEEQQFLSPFFARAERGEMATSAEIQQAFEARIGHEVDDSTIYRLLNRHGWRKLMPRPKHPKASKEAQEQFKKTLRHRFKRQSQRARQKTNDQSSEWRKMRGALAASHVRNGVGLRPASDLLYLHR